MLLPPLRSAKGICTPNRLGSANAVAAGAMAWNGGAVVELSTGTGGESRGRRVTLWVLAFLVMAAAVVYQRRTGPTYPARGSVSIAGKALDFRLLRSQVTTAEAPVELAAPVGVDGTLRWRRLRSDDEWQRVPMRREGEMLRATLPIQPPAGKVEYLLELAAADGSATVQPDGKPVVLRYRGDVPAWLLLPHIFCMFVGLLIAVRAGLAALVSPTGVTRLARLALGGMTLGGMILGPMVQKHAFGAYWTGWPLGQDLTDDKTLWMWLAWVVAVLVLGRGAGEGRPWRRLVVALSMAVSLAVYMVPHSARGSELDYHKLEQGVSATDAIHTGR